MRYVNGFFCVVLVLFTIVQYNDPDAILWILIYGISAVWAGLAAFRPARFAHNQLLLTVFGVTLVAIAGGAIYDWPQSIAEWWQNEVVRGGMSPDYEVVREGLGLIIATVALLVVAYTLWRARRVPPLAQQAG
jgi:Transmembrane family 220, helix